MRLHQVFHCSLLEPYAISTIVNRVTPPPPLVQLVNGPEYEVVMVLDSKNYAINYIILWIGWVMIQMIECVNLLRISSSIPQQT